MGPEDWEELQRNLMETIPVYDRINRFATLGQVSKWRRIVREMLPEGKILEVGCGPGSFAVDVTEKDLVCLDPIPEMLETASRRVNETRKERELPPAVFVESTAEDMPFEDDSFDAICSLFSFRDWYDKKLGLSECRRVLKPNSPIIIIDPAKINRFHGILGVLWMKVWVGAYARFVCGQRNHPWKWLTKTYAEFGTTRDYVSMLEEVGFRDVRARVIFPGMATIWSARSP